MRFLSLFLFTLGVGMFAAGHNFDNPLIGYFVAMAGVEVSEFSTTMTRIPPKAL